MDEASSALAPSKGAPRDFSVWPLAASRERTGLASLIVLGVMITASLGTLGTLGPPLGSQEAPSILGGLLGSLLGIGLTFLVYWVYGRAAPEASIRLGPSGFEVPRSPHSNLQTQVAYLDVQTISVLPRKGIQQALLLIGTSKRTYWIPIKRLGTQEQGDQLRLELRKRIATQPDGDRLLEAMDRREADNQAAMKRWSVVTSGLGLLLLFGFVLEFAKGCLDHPLKLIPLGACVPTLAFKGEWHRLLTGTFLHVNFTHLMFNLSALLVLGSILEKVSGRWRVLLVFWVSAATGSLASALFERSFMMVGASTTVFGLLGAMAVMHLKYWASFPVVFRQNVLWWVFILGINFALPIVIPQIDWIAHLGGLAGGALVAWISLAGQKEFRISPPAGPVLKAGALIATALGALALVFVAKPALDSRPIDFGQIAKTIESSGKVPAPVANAFAWELARDRKADRENLDLAMRLAARAVEDQPEEPAFLDTLAYIHHRAGRSSAAIEHQLEAIARAEADGRDMSFYTSRLGLMLGKRIGQRDPADGTSSDVDLIARPIAPRPGDSAARIEVEVTGSCPESLEAWLLVRRRGHLDGILRVRMAGDASAAGPITAAGPPGTNHLNAYAKAQGVNTTAGLVICRADPPPPRPKAAYWKIVRRARRLPGPLAP